MTLANFNSNFNWQLRMLKEAAECCGIVPTIPPVPPPPVECLFYYSPNVPVGGYTVEGILFDQDPAINAVLNPLGIYYLSYYDITDNFNFVMTYVGSSQPTYVPQVEDSLGNPVTITWDSCCTKTCYEVTLNTDWTTDSCKYFWFGLNVSPFFPDGFPLNDQATWQAFLEFFYGPQVVVTNTVTPTTVYLKIDNAYICDIPIIETQVIPSTDMYPCGQPPVNCYFYGKLHDPSCFQFGDGGWQLNGLSVFGGWASLMQAPPYGTVGNAVLYADNTAGCGPFNYSDYYFWTIVPSTTPSLPPLAGSDPNGGEITVNMLGPICATKCYEKSVVTTGAFIIGFNSAEVNITDYSIFVDLSSPTVGADLTSQLGQYYPSPPLNIIVTAIGLSEYTIRIEGLYSTSTSVFLYMDDSSVIELPEVPC